MQIGFVTQWFDPEEGSAAIPGAMVRALEDLGHEVDVLTGFPNYPHGRLYEGYRLRPRLRETLGSTRVNRVVLYPSHDRSPIRRAANFISFALAASTLGLPSLRRTDVALVYSTPATVGLAGIALRARFRKPFVLFIQDLWPDTVIATRMVPPRLSQLAEVALSRFCERVYRSAARIAVISPSMRDLLVARGVEPDRIDLIYNWVDEQTFRPSESYESRPESGNFDVMYAGNIGDVQGLETAVEAIALMADSPHVRLRLVGSGVAEKRLTELAKRRGVEDRVLFEGPRPLREMPAVMSTADVQLVCLKDLPLFHATMPSKMQAILACGLPVLVSAPGDAGVLAESSEAGVSCPPEDPAALVAALRGLSGMPRESLVALGRKGRSFYETELSAAVGSRRLAESLASAMRSSGGSDL